MQFIAEYIRRNDLFFLSHVSTWNAIAVFLYYEFLRKQRKWDGLGSVLYAFSWATCIVGFTSFQTIRNSGTVYDTASRMLGLNDRASVELGLTIYDTFFHFGPLIMMVKYAPAKSPVSLLSVILLLTPFYFLYSDDLLLELYPAVNKALLRVLAPLIALSAFSLKYKQAYL